MPSDAGGVCRLAGALRELTEHVGEHPATVWWWDVAAAQERRGALYGWRTTPEGRREALVLARGPADACSVRWRDCVRWLPAALIRHRRE